MTTTISTNPHPALPSGERAVDMSSRYSPEPAFRQPARCRVAYTIADGQMVGTVTFPDKPLQRFVGVGDLEERLAIGAGQLVLIDLQEHPLPGAGPGTGGEIAHAIGRLRAACQLTREIAGSLCLGLKYRPQTEADERRGRCTS